MFVKVSEYNLVENRVTLVSKDVEIASQGDQVGLQLSVKILPQTPRAHADSSTVMAVPLLVLDDVLYLILVVGS